MQLAQLNVAESLYPVDDPRMIGFTGRIDVINALAERAPGFIWRLVDDNEEIDGALDLRLPGSETTLVNMSVWENVESLYHFVYKTAHAKVMKDRKDWFVTPTEQFMVLWWVADDHQPDRDEARAKLDYLRENGPTPDAFTFQIPFDETGNPITPNFPKKDCA